MMFHVRGAYDAPIVRVGSSTRVGSVTSTSEAINKLNAYIASASPRHDLSTESWRAVWIARFGSIDALANKGGVSALLSDIDACAPSYAGGCDRATDDVFNGMNRDLGLSADNGWMSFTQMMRWLGRHPVNPEDAATEAPPPVDPSVVSDADRASAAMTDDQIEATCGPIAYFFGGLDACRTVFQKQRADAIAKIARLEGESGLMIAPSGETLMVARPSSEPGRAGGSVVAPLAIGALAGAGLYLAGLSIAVASIPIAAAAIYAATR